MEHVARVREFAYPDELQKQLENCATYYVTLTVSSSEAITIITAGGNCGTLSYGLNNAGFRRDANTYDVTSRASLSMATNAMDGHSNVSSVIADIELCHRHPWLYPSSTEQTEELNTFRGVLSARYEIYPACSTAIGVYRASSILSIMTR